MNLHAELCLDTHTPDVKPLHADAVRPFIFIEIAGLSLWGHDPEAFDRLARACQTAALSLRGEQQQRANEQQPIHVANAEGRS